MLRRDEPLGLDQGLFACFGRWLRDGWLPYRDLFDSKPPLFLYTWVLAWAGGSPGGAWLFEAAWLAATAGVAFALARRLWNRWAGLATAALLFVGLWMPGFGGYWSRLQAEELLVLPTLGAAWFAVSALDRPRAALWCGVLTGIVGLYKIPALVVGGGWVVLWVAALARRDVLARVGWLAAGVVVPWLAAAAWFAAHGALGELVTGIWSYQRHWIAQIDPPWDRVLDGFATTAARELAPLWIAAATGVALAARRKPARAWWLAAWIVLAAAAVIAQRQLAGYHFLLLVPGLALAGGYGVAALGDAVIAMRGAARAAGAAVLAAIVVLLAVALASWRAYDVDGVRGYDRELFSPADDAAVAAYIAAHTQPGDGILVWALAPDIYALADRHPVTRYPFHRLLVTDAPLAHAIPGRDARRAELLARLRAEPPAYIVLGTHDANPFEPDSITSLFAFRELAQIVQHDYHEETKLGRFVVLARGAPAR